MGISACIIAKNEEANIQRCLESIRDIADEIILVDTGSKDQTLKIAAEYGCRIFKENWTHDFSAARNASLEQASQDWILVIDCDEEVVEESKSLIVDLCQTQENIEGFGVQVQNIIDGVPSYSTMQLRLFRNRKEYRYEGIIHEQIGEAIAKANPASYILSSSVVFLHYGYETDAELVAKKTKRNLEILHAVAEEKRDGMFYLHLGAEYVRLNDYPKAVEIYQKASEITTTSQPYFTILAHRLAEALFRNKDYEKCLQYCRQVLEIFPDFRALYFVQFSCYSEMRSFPDALSALKTFKKLAETPHKYPILGYEHLNDVDGLIELLESKLGNPQKNA